MNMSKVITHIKMMLNLNQITLPIKDEVTGQPVPTENIIYEVLKNITIPTFSQYAPWKRSGIYDLKDMECLDRQRMLWRLPKELTITPVLYIDSIKVPHNNYRATLGELTPTYSVNLSAQSVVTAQAYNMVAGEMRAYPTWEQGDGDQVYLYGFPRIPLRFSVACEHLPNGESIGNGYYASFLELAILDMKEFVYNALIRYDGMPSAHGQVNLGIQEWASASEARNSLLEKWADTFHLDMDWESWM